MFLFFVVFTVTAVHWQLRDLLHCPVSTGELYHVDGRNIQRTVLRGRKLGDEEVPDVTIIDRMDQAPCSLVATPDYVVAGGQNSELLVRRTGEDSGVALHDSNIGGSINNSLCISKVGGESRLLVSNNNSVIKVYTLPSMTGVTTIQQGVAVNATAVSPDGQFMVTVGDNRKVMLYGVSSSGSYGRITALSEYSDNGFSCAWSPSSMHFAAASQDGRTIVWDRRSDRKPLARLRSSVALYSDRGACRLVRWAPTASADLLMFAEHSSRVHLVDARDFATEQVLALDSGPFGERDVSGVAWSPDSSRLYIGASDFVEEYEVDVVGRRRFGDSSVI